MFNNKRYLTCGVASTIPLELQLFLWNCVDELPDDRDYLQIFKLEPFGEMQRITHTSENPITEKLYIIDDGDHSTMLLSEEY